MERNTNMDKVLFDYAEYKKLIKVVAEGSNLEDRAGDLGMVEDALNSCTTYVEAVDAMENAMPRLRANYEGDDYRDRIKNYDRTRRLAHDAAIAHCAILNRVSKMYGCDKICLADRDDRYEVGDYCLDVVSAIFKNRQR